MAKILVIDDDPDIRPMMRLLLTRLGHIPTLASRGEEGLAAAKAGDFDLVILDLMMPDLDGYEVTRRLRADPKTRDLPILIFTARTQAADEQGALEAGADGYLPKMGEPQELGAKIVEVLKIGQARRAPQPPAPSKPVGGPIAQPQPVTGQPPAELPQTPVTSRMIVSLGLRGGVGATTLAVNLAGVLARAGRRVCLLDLAPAGGQVAVHLHVRPRATWADLPLMPDPNTIRQAFARHESGIFVLAAPPTPARQFLPSETFQAILKVVNGVFADIVIDAAPGLGDSTSAALRQAQHVLLVLRPDVGSVQTAANALRALANLPVANNHIRVALNQVSHEPGLPQATVEKALGRPVDLVIPFDRLQATALMQGTPLVFMPTNAPLSLAIRNFTAKL